MRAGAYTIHQSLTAEAAAVLKLALGLARRRGHAQVTPLHVAFALLTTGSAAAPPSLGAFSSSSPAAAAAYGLLKRACLRSHPSASHPLQCRALELCFNVALNRLPTSSPHTHSHSSPPGASSFASSLIQASPTLSNALVAALKRAQANQRRGTCVELQHQPPTTQQQQQQQNQQPPLLAIKVELDQLVISILDDPSVSRVMREAGFSSATVKTNLEEEDTAAALIIPSSASSSPPPPHPAPHFFIDPSSSGMWPAAQFLAMSSSSSKQEQDDDVRAVLDVMVRKKQGRCSSSNPVVVGDSASMAEAVASDLLRRLERGDVPEDLAGAHLLKLQLSYVHVRLMSRADVDARAAELRRAVDAANLHYHHRAGGGGLVVYVGDLRWAIDEEPTASSSSAAAAATYSPVEHMVAELGRLLDDLWASRGRRAWLVATASYQTYMRWQQQQQRRRRSHRQPEDAWALQAVLVPTAGGTGLALNNLHPPPSASGAPMQAAMLTMQQAGQSPFTMAAERDGHDEKLVLCTECSKNYEREASLVKAEADAEGPRASLPAWLVPDRPPADQAQHHKDKYLLELKRKWSRLCRKLHLCSNSNPPCSAPWPWWSGPACLPPCRPSIAGFLGLEALMAHGKSRTNEWSPPPSSAPPHRGLTVSPRCHQDVGTALALGNLPLSDTATSDGRASPGSGGGGSSAVAARALEQRLRRNVPWQPAAVAAEIAGAVVAAGDKGVWLYVKGSDHAAVRRAAAVIAEARCGSAGRVVVVSAADQMSKLDVVARACDLGGGGGKGKVVVVVGDVERAPEDVVDRLVAASRSGALKGPAGRELDLSGCVVVLTTARFTGVATDDVISLRLWSEEDEAPSGDLKRKPDAESLSLPTESKRPRVDAGRGLDLNIDLCDDDDDDSENDEEEEEAIPSDITHQGSDDEVEHQGHSLLESVAYRVVTLDDAGCPRGHFRAMLLRALGEPSKMVRVDDEAVEAVAAASGHFLDETLERWAAEVLAPAAATVRNGGKGMVVVLGVGRGGVGARQAGFMGSVLPSRVHVD